MLPFGLVDGVPVRVVIRIHFLVGRVPVPCWLLSLALRMIRLHLRVALPFIAQCKSGQYCLRLPHALLRRQRYQLRGALASEYVLDSLLVEHNVDAEIGVGVLGQRRRVRLLRRQRKPIHASPFADLSPFLSIHFVDLVIENGGRVDRHLFSSQNLNLRLLVESWKNASRLPCTLLRAHRASLLSLRFDRPDPQAHAGQLLWLVHPGLGLQSMMFHYVFYNYKICSI